MMFENEVRLKCFLDCFSGDKVEAGLSVTPGKVEQGGNFELGILLKLGMPVPAIFEGKVVCELPNGFKGASESRLEATGNDGELGCKFLFEVADALPGEYELWGTVHARAEKTKEYDEILEISPVKLKVVQKNVRIKSCIAERAALPQGEIAKVKVVVEYPSEHKAKGSLGIELTGKGSLKHRVVRPDAQKIALTGEREYVWEFKLPKDETGTGSYGCIVSFQSKDVPSTNARFDDILRIVKAKELIVEKLEASPSTASFGKKLRIEGSIANVGLEDARAETLIFIDHGEARLFERKQDIEVRKGARENIVVEVALPEKPGMDADRLSCQLEGRLEGGERFSMAIEVPIKRTHEFKVAAATMDRHVCLPGERVRLTAYVADEGSEAGNEVAVECTLADKNGKVTFQKESRGIVGASERPFNFEFDVPHDVKAGAYDCAVAVRLGDETKKVRFKAMLQVEMPVQLSTKLVVERAQGDGLQCYTREGEEIMRVEKDGALAAYYLNSGKWLYEYGGKVVYGLGWSDALMKNAKFPEMLFDAILRRRKLPGGKAERAAAVWLESALCWNILAGGNADWRNGIGAKLKKMKFDEPVCAEARAILVGEKADYDFTNMPLGDVFATILEGKVGDDAAGASLDERLQYSIEESCEGRPGKEEKHDGRAVLLAALASDAAYFIEAAGVKTPAAYARYCAVACYYYMIALMERGQKGEVPRALAELLAGAAKDACSDFLAISSEWKTRAEGYRLNMAARKNMALCRRAIDAKLANEEVAASKGARAKFELSIKNSAEDALSVDVQVALPSDAWAVVDPKAEISDGVHSMNFEVPPKNEKNIELIVLFPRMLRNDKYSGIILIKGRQGMHANETI